MKTPAIPMRREVTLSWLRMFSQVMRRLIHGGSFIITIFTPNPGFPVVGYFPLRVCFDRHVRCEDILLLVDLHGSVVSFASRSSVGSFAFMPGLVLSLLDVKIIVKVVY